VVKVDKSQQRMIFHASLPYAPDEIQHLENFRAYLANNNL
jgi:hypothetical protein